MKFPIEVKGIDWKLLLNPIGPSFMPRGEEGGWVAVRPVGDKKTYLGIFLGDLALPDAAFDDKTGILTVESGRGNPIIWVFDLKKTILGIESWWGPIKTPEDLKQISDTDIKNVWYVRALRELNGEGSAEPTPDDQEMITRGMLQRIVNALFFHHRNESVAVDLVKTYGLKDPHGHYGT